ncbi:hypothetical protein PMSD_06045 [Paenibacillus macquariensis subsp. defensor]|nr:hypothetical protein PMSD_06045 [Paenibacillus macquariensis subsp. defensor]
MKIFPEDYELITLFESNPVTLDDEIPWYYNVLFFKLSRDDLNLEVSIEPACNRMNIRLSNGKERTLFDIGFDEIIGIEMFKDSYSEGLLIILDETDSNITIRLETKPYIKVISTREKNFRK